jgi:hypothetical protein
MKKFVTICICFAALSATVLAVVYDEDNYSADGRIYQPPPDWQIPGQDNSPGRGVHHPGEDCGRCHRVGGRAEAYLFTMAGTLYSDRSGRSVLKGGEIIMQDREGNVISMTSNGAGNFWTTTPVASDPYTVATYHGHEPFVPLYVEDEETGGLLQPAPAEDPKTWKYKTWVRKGKAYRPMVSIAGVGGGSATTTRMSCNMHHGGVAHRSGALWVGKGPTLPSYPASELSYRKHIYPILRSNCSPCHIPGRTITSMNTKTDHEDPSTAVDYSDELDLMTYGGSDVYAPIYDPKIRYKVIGFELISKDGVAEVVNTDEPEMSLLLRKTLYGEDLHAGGPFWSERSPDYVAILQWIEEGALNN